MDNKPSDSDFTQQRMKACVFTQTPLQYAAEFLLIGVLFISLGIYLYTDATAVHEVYKRYDDVCNIGKKCKLTMHIPDRLDSPVFLYYELTKFYQNHRYYSKSRDARQLMGDHRTKSEVREYCTPVVTMDDLEFSTNLTLDGSDVASPCGLIARSYFNDTFKLFYPDSEGQVTIHEKHITWKIDRDEMFDRQTNWKRKQWTDVENEHFMVWMNVAGLSTFRKLWGRIDDDLHSGHYNLEITNEYDVNDFGGEKRILLSTVGTFGGKITFIAVVYLAIGSSAMLGAGLLVLAHFLKRRYS